jgi:ankyrin repeat protein
MRSEDKSDVYITRILHLFLSHPLFDVNSYDYNGNTLIHIVADMDDPRFLKYFLEIRHRNLEVDKPKNDPYMRMTALHEACQSMSMDNIQLLLVLGKANPNFRTKSGSSALHLILQADLGREHYKIPTVQLLLEHGADPNAVNGDGQRPLHLCRDPDICVLLLQNGADPELENADGQTAVIYARIKHRRRW